VKDAGVVKDDASMPARVVVCMANMHAYSEQRCQDGNLPLGQSRPAEMPIAECVAVWREGIPGRYEGYRQKCLERADRDAK
jgi:hypothetical protein